MKCLELFCGTKSFGKAVPSNWEVISVDILEKFNPDICCDIMDLDYTIWEEGEFDIIWASPPCRFFSICRNAWIGKYTKHNKCILTKELMEEDMIKHGLPPVHKALEIIEYLKPKYWFMENPKTGRLKNYIKDLNYIDVNYCRFGFDYAKPTRIWTNRKDLEESACKCNCKEVGKVHNKKWVHRSKVERYRIPEKLIEYLVK